MFFKKYIIYENKLSEQLRSPLVIDLDGDGVETLTAAGLVRMTGFWFEISTETAR